MSSMDYDIIRYGKDLDLRKTSDRGGSTGKAPTVSGIENMQKAIEYRVTKRVQELLLEPDFGVDMRVDSANTPAYRMELANRTKDSLRADPRIAEARVAVSTYQMSTLLIEVAVRIQGEDGFLPTRSFQIEV